MICKTGSHDIALIDWTRPRWLTEEPQIEDACKLEREGKGTVYDDGDGGPVQWVPNINLYYALPTPGELKGET
jgi:hypothetical protein